ncbi:unnamed protein product [Arctogadus glacialis]
MNMLKNPPQSSQGIKAARCSNTEPEPRIWGYGNVVATEKGNYFMHSRHDSRACTLCGLKLTRVDSIHTMQLVRGVKRHVPSSDLRLSQNLACSPMPLTTHG